MEDQDPEDEEDYDIPHEEPSDGEGPSPYEGYTSDHAPYPLEVEGSRPTVALDVDRCLTLYTPLNSKVPRICGRYCTGPGCCHRRVTLPHVQLRNSRLHRAREGTYDLKAARRVTAKIATGMNKNVAVTEGTQEERQSP